MPEGGQTSEPSQREVESPLLRTQRAREAARAKGVESGESGGTGPGLPGRRDGRHVCSAKTEGTRPKEPEPVFARRVRVKAPARLQVQA